MNNEVENLGSSTIETPNNEEPKKGCWRRLLELAERCLSHEDKDKWLEQMRGNLGLMATVIATMTYQMALNPPGGIRSIRDDPHPRSDTNNAYAYPPGANNDYANSPGPNIPGTNDQRKYCGNFGRGTYWDLCPGQAVLGMCITLTSLAASYIIAVAMTLPIDVGYLGSETLPQKK
ncbi:ankyrin repeat plant-like protein [Trifolium medium]|uniref:Ankyrin repeat plant-like protein n=1 Tax=Trifolium medium TaxID=97028 RepID=A0A392LWK8_9FABA|nr:ankyrin repeat plant-like protein [Trifolium medium]